MRPRLGDRFALRDDLLARLAAMPAEPTGEHTLGDVLDVTGDPTILRIAGLWARVADSVCAYSEMTSGEAYLNTVQDWTDTRRVVELVGYRPTQRTAGHGWIRVETTASAAPLVPAGTTVQAPGTPTRSMQSYEVAADTQLRSDWASLTITGVPQPGSPTGDQLRFLSDPGFSPSDRVVFVAEALKVSIPTTWGSWLNWTPIYLFAATPEMVATNIISNVAQSLVIPSTGLTLQGVARVTTRGDDLGATLLTFDRSLDSLLPANAAVAYGAYRVRAELRVPTQLDMISYLDNSKPPASQTVRATYPTNEPSEAIGKNWVYVEDASEASVGQHLILFTDTGKDCVVGTIRAIRSDYWHIAPGTPRPVAKIELSENLPMLFGQFTPVNVLLVDPRQSARHYQLPPLQPGDMAARIHPRPRSLPTQLAIQTTVDGATTWELAGCTANKNDSSSDTGGQIISLTIPRRGTADYVNNTGAATGNLVPIQHGASQSGSLVSTAAGTMIAGPVTGDVDAAGVVTNSLVIAVDGERFDEVPTLYGRGADEPVYATRLAADGRLVVTFGDGVNGMLPRGDIEGRWRTGGGLEGELDGAEINVLAGSVIGVTKIAGVGPITGAADQEDPVRMRRAAGARIRALDRAVAIGDLADLALTVPGTSHSVAWHGSGPPGCACAGSGVHVAFLRMSANTVRSPADTELHSVSGFLDSRRDTTVPLCVCAAIPSPVTVSGALVIDPRRQPAAVCTAVQTALLDTAGPLAPLSRDLGVPMDASDVVKMAQPVTGVVGITALTLTGAITVGTTGDISLGRVPALAYELLYLADTDLWGSPS